MSKKKKTSGSKKPKPHLYGPNKVSYDHFKHAIDIAKECKTEKSDKLHPKVGVVIVKNGKVISSAFRGEAGKGEHAEYIALEKKAGGNPKVQGADLITTLEPCTVRSHDKRPCVSWVKSRNIRKVWIATLDPNPLIAGYGELQLQEDGIKIGRFPDDLTEEVLEDNNAFFEWIRDKRPVITKNEQKSERIIIIDYLKESLRQDIQTRAMLLDKMISLNRPTPLFDTLEDMNKDVTQHAKSIKVIMEQALAVQIDSVGSWIQLGSALMKIEFYGVAVQAYRIATEIDATSKMAWYGLANSELELNRVDTIWPFQYIVEEMDSSPDKIRSQAWIKQSDFEEPDIRVRIAARALQLGQNVSDIWRLVEEAAVESNKHLITKKLPKDQQKEYEEKQMKETSAWMYMGLLFDKIGEEEKKLFCYEIVDKRVFTPEVRQALKLNWYRVATGYPDFLKSDVE